MCGPTEIECRISRGLNDVAGNALEQIAKSIGQAAYEGIQAIATFWIHQPSPALSVGADSSSPRNSAIVDFLQGNVLWVSAAIFTVAVLVAGMRLAWEQRARPLQELLKATMVFVAVGAAGSATLQLLAEWSDKLAEAIIRSAHPNDTTLATALADVMLQGSLGTVTGTKPATLIMMFAGVAVILAALIQVVLMVIRSAMLILLAGTFPLAAAATNTEIGRSWFRKYCGWSLAFIAYKPAAALIYAAALKMNESGIGQSGNSFVQTTTGLMMLFLAIFALPALLRFLVPVTAAVAGGGSGMGSAVADPGGMATGAVGVGRSVFGRGGGGSGRSGGGSSGRGASGAVGVGSHPGVVAAGGMVNGARKFAGGLAGAAAHSAGEQGGGSTTPTSSFGPLSQAGGSREPRRERKGPSGSTPSAPR
ncbi:type IV secretion system protein [Kribbella sp. NBC_00889]|uniref:type IV secretion system protein n=1 Tax=Kribbella sp. NBC_00889 TaxID=2975974 RepID=UPI00386FCF25|nr:type IV secretion system protein [Kribbella sp. NBC_00889]